MKIGFIGLGNMAGAMMGGIIKAGISASDIIGYDVTEGARNKTAERDGIVIASGNVEVARQADVLVLSVKPQYYAEVISQIRDSVREDCLVITIAPGKTLSWLKEQFGRSLHIIRCMPNTPALYGAGCTGYCPNENVTPADLETAEKLLSSFSRAYKVDEKLMDVVVGIGGSSPAYVFMFIEAMADAAVSQGMPRQMAYEMSAQAVLGSAKMVLESGRHPGELKDMVCSPAGTTIEAVKVLEELGFRGAVIDAVDACVEKSRSL